MAPRSNFIKRSHRHEEPRSKKDYTAGNKHLKKKPLRLTKSRNQIKKQRKIGAVKEAQNQLRRFSQASILAVAITGFLLLLFYNGEETFAQEDGALDSALISDSSESALVDEAAFEETLTVSEDTAVDEEPEEFREATKDEALITIRNLWDGFYSNLPKMVVALVALVLGWLLTRMVKFILRRTIGNWRSGGAIITLVAISIWLMAIGVAVSVVAGDIRALLGSLGLVGLALSWSLQTPIESFTGWLMNSFRQYYKVGDRISVGEVFGDVYKIDFLTTTVWEIGAPYRPGFVQAEQSTGRLVTFPNNEILSGTVVNLTGDFPYVWDELAIAVANESDLKESMRIVEEVSTKLLANYMQKPARKYEAILRGANLDYNVADKPEVYISLNESWTDVVVRYLVGARERRTWKSNLTIHIMEALNRPENKEKAISVYPRQQLQFVDNIGLPFEVKNQKISDTVGQPPPKKSGGTSGEMS